MENDSESTKTWISDKTRERLEAGCGIAFIASFYGFLAWCLFTKDLWLFVKVMFFPLILMYKLFLLLFKLWGIISWWTIPITIIAFLATFTGIILILGKLGIIDTTPGRPRCGSGGLNYNDYNEE